jgi:hypothetical protein
MTDNKSFETFNAKDWIDKNYPNLEQKEEYKLIQFILQFRRTLDDLSKRDDVNCNLNVSQDSTLRPIENMIVVYEGLLAMTNTMIAFNDEHTQKCTNEESKYSKEEQERLVQLTIRSRMEFIKSIKVGENYKTRQIDYKKKMDEFAYNTNILNLIKEYCASKLATIKNLHSVIALITELELRVKNSNDDLLDCLMISDNLLSTLGTYNDVQIVKNLNNRMLLCKDVIKSKIMNNWETSMQLLFENPTEATVKLNNLCKLIDLLNAEEIRTQVINKWALVKIQAYKQMATSQTSQSELDIILDKHFTYLFNELNDLKLSEYCKFFPEEWTIDAAFVEKWFECAKYYFTIIIKNAEKKAIENRTLIIATKIAEETAAKKNSEAISDNGNSDYQDSLKFVVFDFMNSLVRTIQFENSIAKKWPHHDEFKFHGYLSTLFHPYMHHFIECEKARFDIFNKTVDSDASWDLNANGMDAHFVDADRILYMIKNGIKRYRKIMPAESFKTLIGVQRNAIASYLNTLTNYLPAEDFNKTNVHLICSTVNTADMILTAWQEFETMASELSNNQNNTQVEELCTKITYTAFESLSKHIVEQLRTHLQHIKEIKSITDANIDSVPKYLHDIINTLHSEISTKIPVSNFTFFCQETAKHFFEMFVEILKKPSVKVTEKIAQQLLYDMSKLRTYMTNTVIELKEAHTRGVEIGFDIFDFDIVPKSEYPSSFKQYVKLLDREFENLDKLLNIFLVPDNMLIERALVNCDSDYFYVFDILNMRGLSSGDQEKLIKQYNSKIKDQTKWIPLRKFTVKSKLEDIRRAVML